MTGAKEQPAGQAERLQPGVRTNQMLDDEAKKGGQGSPENDGSAPGQETSHREGEDRKGDQGEGTPDR